MTFSGRFAEIARDDRHAHQKNVRYAAPLNTHRRKPIKRKRPGKDQLRAADPRGSGACTGDFSIRIRENTKIIFPICGTEIETGRR